MFRVCVLIYRCKQGNEITDFSFSLFFFFFLRSEHYQDRIIKIRSNNARQHKSEKPLQRVLWNIKLEKDV